MSARILIALACLSLVFIAPSQGVPPRPGHTYDFPIYTNHPPGRQLSGGHAPATTPPLTAEETRKMIQAPSGFDVRLFAAEPEVVNPVAMTWDARGRLWVLELYEYPSGAPRGTKGRDRIKILEDTDADGVADKVKVFADGYSLATGMELGNGGVYLGAAPNFYFIKDTNGDDKADQETVLLSGFGMEDRHELLNGFAWGPDGWLYMTHGVFTYSSVRDPANQGRNAVKMDAALARFHPGTKAFEVVADGTSNPWGVDWNAQGDAFVSACVIHHLFHMAPGGLYNRQGGAWMNPYGYVGDLPSKGLPALVDWRHYRAAHAGLQVYQGPQYPKEWQGLVFLGNIHQNAINCDRLANLGSTFTAQKESTLLGKDQGSQQVGAGNFLVSKDPWFRPVSVKTGPDGALWVMDWSDRYPCYQNANADPEGVDREYGRIWRVVHVGETKGKPVPSRPDRTMDLEAGAKSQSPKEMAQLLTHPNNWQRRQAQRLWKESGNAAIYAVLEWWVDIGLWKKNRSKLEPALASLEEPPLPSRLTALWTLGAAGKIPPAILRNLAGDAHSEVRIWAARFLGEQNQTELDTLLLLARDKEPGVRAAAAIAARRFTSGAFTVDTPPGIDLATPKLLPLFNALVSHPSVEGDTYYPHIVWMAMEPRVAEEPGSFYPLFAENASSPVTAYCAYRAMRRVCDIAEASKRMQQLNEAMTFLGTTASKPALAQALLDGLIKAQEAKGAPPTLELDPIFASLYAQPALADKARRLATLFGDTAASRMLIAKINDPAARADDRLRGVQAARETKDDVSRAALLKLIASEQKDQALLVAAVRAAAAVGGDEVAEPIVKAWDRFTPATRRAAAEVLVTRTASAKTLLTGVDRKGVKPDDISATARRALARNGNAAVAAEADRLLGRYRASGEDKLKLIESKRKVVLAGKPDIDKGHELAKTLCLTCHKLYGEGADIGPDLTGVGRSTLDALLHNVIAPNEIIGNGYESTEVVLQDGTTLAGRVVEDTGTRMKLVAAGPVEHAIAKADIARENGQPKIRKSDLSLMPEGLEQMSDDDFRNLIWFLLNPPADKRPWTPELRKELLGGE